MSNLFRKYVSSKKSLTDKLLDEITDFDIYCELIGMDLELGQTISSPLREDDTRASFSLYVPTELEDIRPDEVWWKDFAGGFGNVFTFVQKFAAFHHGLVLEKRYDIIKFIDSELGLGLFDTEKVAHEKRVIDYEAAKLKKEILFKSRPFTRRDLLWWARFGIDEDTLKKFNVRSVQYLLGEDYSIKYEFKRTELAFVYVVYDKVKLYCPEEDEFKWRNTCPGHYLFGQQQLEGHDNLIITKSLKDIMCFYSLINCDCLAPQGEAWHFPDELVASLKEKYKNIFVVMDYDPAGIEAAERLEAQGFTVRWISQEQTLINGKLKVLDKDISDYIKNHGVDAGLALVKSMFPEIEESLFKNDRPEIIRLVMEKLAA